MMMPLRYARRWQYEWRVAWLEKVVSFCELTRVQGAHDVRGPSSPVKSTGRIVSAVGGVAKRVNCGGFNHCLAADDRHVQK